MNPQKQLDSNSIPMFKQIGIVILIVSIIVSIIAYLLFKHYDWSIFLYSLIPVSLSIYSLYSLLIIPKRMYSIFRYEIYENRIDLQSGVFFITRTVIPMFRVQHVQTEQGPFLNKFGLTKLTIYTAGSVYQIPAVSEKVAEELREEIALLTKGLE